MELKQVNLDRKPKDVLCGSFVFATFVSLRLLKKKKKLGPMVAFGLHCIHVLTSLVPCNLVY
jgi:hypothetical protein